MSYLKKEFLIDDEIIYLNHGSFGACPRFVFDIYQEWQLELERQPVEFLGRRAPELLADARRQLADYLNTEPDHIVYFPNPTTAINMVARSLDLESGDEILTTDHEYGAMDRTWRFICYKTGANYIHKPIPLPVTNHEDFIEAFWQGVTPRTKAVFISHITSPTALIFPVAEICQRARDQEIISVIDGAHTPGHIPLDLSKIGADIYTGACHKWLCAPKGAAFLYAHPDIQPSLEPLVVSWGYESEKPGPSKFIDYHEWQGTRDLSAFLSVPSAIQFQNENHWDIIRQDCHQLASQARHRINAITGMQPISPDGQEWFGQMVAVRLPEEIDPEALKARLYNEYRIEILAHTWNDLPLMRISFQAYNRQADLDSLVEGLIELLPGL
jgi:isopenicillin-N epimerase